MRAPPEAQTISSGSRLCSACSIPFVIFSPVAAPMLPPMNAKSKHTMTSSWPASAPSPQVTASSTPVFVRLCSIRLLYGWESLKPSTSWAVMARSCSLKDPGSSSIPIRSDARSRK